MKYRLSKKGLNFIKGWEGFVPFIYDDLVRVNGKYVEWKGGKIIGTLTIGYGHTSAARGKYPMTVGTRITEARAAQLLDEDLDPVEEYVNRIVKVPLTQGQFDALVSITFNMGEGNFRKSTLLARLNAGDYRGAREAFDLYVYSKGRRLQGLVNRRNAEQVLWDIPDPVKAMPKQKVIEVTPEKSDPIKATPREIDQPAQPRASTTVEGGGGIATATAGTGGMIEQGTTAFDKASEYADKAASAVNTAEQLGVQPITLSSIIGTKAAAFLGYLLTSPFFWFSLALFVIGLAIYLARRWKSKQEVIPGEYELAGTPLPDLIADDSGYAGIDTTDDAIDRYYRVDPAELQESYETPVEINRPVKRRKRKAS